MKLKLISIDPFSPPLEFEVQNWPAVIGGDLRSCDVVIADRWIGGVQCELTVVDGHLQLRSLSPKSKDGLLINNSSVRDSPLMPGDMLTIGIRTFRVSYRRAPKKNGKLTAATTQA